MKVHSFATIANKRLSSGTDDQKEDKVDLEYASEHL